MGTDFLIFVIDFVPFFDQNNYFQSINYLYIIKLLLSFLLFFTLFSFKATPQITVSAKNASRHIGETVKIVDKAFDGSKIKQTNMVLIDIGGNRPDQFLTIIISNPAEISSKASLILIIRAGT